jgi:hypothetical protein
LPTAAGLVFGKIIAPGSKGGDGNTTTDAEEGDVLDCDGTAMQDMGGRPAPASSLEFFSRFIVARDQNRRARHETQNVDAALEVAARGGEIAGTNEHIDALCTLSQLVRSCAISMKIAEQEQLHLPSSCPS